MSAVPHVPKLPVFPSAQCIVHSAQLISLQNTYKNQVWAEPTLNYALCTMHCTLNKNRLF